MEAIELFSAKICPFAHRCRLTLMEKHLRFELIEIDLRNKPSWYFKIHPDGAVPALRQGHFLLRESLVINEFLEELVRSPALCRPMSVSAQKPGFGLTLLGHSLCRSFTDCLEKKIRYKKTPSSTRCMNSWESLKIISLKINLALFGLDRC